MKFSLDVKGFEKREKFVFDSTIERGKFRFSPQEFFGRRKIDIPCRVFVGWIIEPLCRNKEQSKHD